MAKLESRGAKTNVIEKQIETRPRGTGVDTVATHWILCGAILASQMRSPHLRVDFNLTTQRLSSQISPSGVGFSLLM